MPESFENEGEISIDFERVNLLDETIKIVPAIIKKHTNRSSAFKSIVLPEMSKPKRKVNNQFADLTEREEAEEERINGLIDTLVHCVN